MIVPFRVSRPDNLLDLSTCIQQQLFPRSRFPIAVQTRAYMHVETRILTYGSS